MSICFEIFVCRFSDEFFKWMLHWVLLLGAFNNDPFVAGPFLHECLGSLTCENQNGGCRQYICLFIYVFTSLHFIIIYLLFSLLIFRPLFSVFLWNNV